MHRTQIYLSERQRKYLPIMAEKMGVENNSEVIRRALDKELERFLEKNKEIVIE